SGMGFLSVPTAFAQVNADQVVNIGRNVLSMDDYMLAIHYFNQAIKAKPYLSDPYFFRAIAKLSLEDYKGAEEDCSLAIERNKFKTEAYKVRGFARQCLGLDALAITDYDIGLNYNPLDKYFLYYKSVALTELKKFEAADSTFSTLLRQYPKFEEGYAARGRLNIARGDTVAALADLDRATDLSKAFINPYLMKAEIAWRRKNWEEAGINMDTAIRLRPEVADLYVNRAFIRYNSDDFFGAMSDYNYALELEPSNTSALFNRALLRYEVRDLSRAEEDLSAVLKLDPENFHALYNRGLIRLELKKNNEALNDFKQIARKYPKFYPVYYAMAEVKRDMGDMKQAMQYVHHADDLVKKYVSNPEKNALDRPTIAAAETKDAKSNNETGEESEIEVMEKFNRLVTVSDAVESQLSYNEKIKGRVQDRNVQVEAEPLYALSFNPAPLTLRSVSNYFRELDDLNNRHIINRQFYLNAGIPSSGDESFTVDLFKYADDLNSLIASGRDRPVDHLALGVTYTMLKNYPEAVVQLSKAIDMDNRFTVAYMARAFARYAE
ncbi:MAG: tetratricopeptide repeat protein, partial [Muribaculaceae bacterium]|nr:tetratricopeptide repeat protein [Muribaculaceae bacterium]